MEATRAFDQASLGSRLTSDGSGVLNLQQGTQDVLLCRLILIASISRLHGSRSKAKRSQWIFLQRGMHGRQPLENYVRFCTVGTHLGHGEVVVQVLRLQPMEEPVAPPIDSGEQRLAEDISLRSGEITHDGGVIAK